MKYWLLTSEFPPFYGGGISTYCFETALMLSEQGHAVTVFTYDNNISGIKESHIRGFTVIRFNPIFTRSSGYLGHVTNISYEFSQIIRRYVLKFGRPDLIESQEYLGIAYYLLQFKHLAYDWCRDIPVIITMHSPSFLYMEYNQVPQYKYPNYWICEMERYCLQAADHVISPSKYMVDELNCRFQLAHERISVVPNPFQVPVAPHVVDNSAADRIVFYGKLTVQKGAFSLLKYFQAMWDEGFQKPLYLIGGQDIVYHPESMTMGEIIRKRYVTYINRGLLILEGKVEPVDLEERLSHAGLVLVPSHNDNLPYVVFEMMALGKLVLASRQGGHAEVIEDGIDGFLFDHNDPQSFALQVKRILALSNSQRLQIASAAKRKVTLHYSHNAIYVRKLELLKRLTSAPNKLPSVFPFVRRSKREIPTNNDSNQEKGLLSVVIPYYNMGKYIESTVASVVASEHVRMEIIIVNDGSSDSSSLEILSKIDGDDVRIINIVNEGVAGARNVGALAARGEFLAFLDADDQVLPGYFAKAIAAITSHDNIDFVGCWTQYFEDSTKVWPTFQPEPPLILYHNLVNSSALVYKRGSFMAAGMNDAKMPFSGLEDYDSVLSMLANGFNGVILPEKLFRYRVRSNSMIRGVTKSKRIQLQQYLFHKYQAYYKEHSEDINGLLTANGPGIALDNPSLDFHLAEHLPFGGAMAMKFIALIKRNRYIKSLAYKIYRFLKK